MTMPDTDRFTDNASFWEEVHRGRDTPVAPRANARLVEIVGDLPPGDALDLGAGGGGDALWLARRGWRVTAVEISHVAVARIAELAAASGLGDRITAERHDLERTFPDGRFDLVTAHYLQTPLSLDRAVALRSAAQALRLGGRLLVVDHGSSAPWSWSRDEHVHFPTPQETADGIGLDPAQWTVDRADAPTRIADGPDGQTAEIVDHVLLVRRTG